MKQRPHPGSRASLHSTLTLARWLGPWAKEAVPHGTSLEHENTILNGRTLRMALHRPRQRPRGVWLVTPGLHYLGPDDPRLDRFCRVLAAAGFVVIAPFLPDFLSLVISPNATADLACVLDRACDLARKESLPPPSVFSISFGSLPAITLCADDSRARALVLFGGFCDFEATVRYAITGRASFEGETLSVERDPLNAPVVHLHLLPFYPASLDRERLALAWRAMVERTWGRNEMKLGEARSTVADAILREHALEGEMRDAFLMGCGLLSGGEALLEEGLARVGDSYRWADPRPFLSRVKPPVAIVHGKDDDVIPYFEAHKMRAALPPNHPHELHVTGMYGHTGASLPSPRAIAKEISTLLRVVRILAMKPVV